MSAAVPDGYPDLAELTALPELDLRASPRIQPAMAAWCRYYGIDFGQRLAGVSHWFGRLPGLPEQIAVQVFLPATDRPRGSCILCHGYLDHSGLYGHVIGHALARQRAVVIWDLPGHGLSSGEPAAIDDFDRYREVLEHLLAWCAEAALPRPWQGLGQSTGGAILMEYLLTTPRPRLVDNILLAPLVRAAGWPAIRLAHLLGRRLLSSVPRRFGGNSGDADFLDLLAHRDPLQSRVIPVSWVTAMLAWEQRFRRLPPSDQAPLIVQGDRDTTVAWRHNLRVLGRLFPRAQVVMLPGAHHHLVNETPRLRRQLFAAIDRYRGDDELD